MKIILISMILSALLAACHTNSSRDDMKACVSLTQGVDEIVVENERLHTLRLRVEEAKEDRERQAAIHRFVKSCAEILAKIDILYEKHELSCKSGLIYRDLHEEAFDIVYRPFVQSQAAIVFESTKLIDFLQNNTQQALYGPFVAAINTFVQDLTKALKNQIQVCYSDFGHNKCQEMEKLLDSSLAVKILPTPEDSLKNKEAPQINDTANQKDAEEVNVKNK